MLKPQVQNNIVLLLISGLVLISAKQVEEVWKVEFVSFEAIKIEAGVSYTIYRGIVKALKDDEDIKLKFSAVTIVDDVNLLTLKDENGESLEPQLRYDPEDKEFYHGKRKNKVSCAVRSDSRHKEVIRSGIKIWLELQE